MPGEGHASPIVWGDRVFTVAAEREKRDRILVCLDRQTGEILWQKLVVSGPLEKLHKQNSYTPVYSERTGLVYVSSSWPKRYLLAIRPDGVGDVTGIARVRE